MGRKFTLILRDIHIWFGMTVPSAANVNIPASLINQVTGKQMSQE
jgi:hypothetical protein